MLPPVPRPAARRRARAPPCVAILDRRLERAGALDGEVGDEFRAVLDRLERGDRAAATRSLADLAREVRCRCFDEPVIAARPRARPTREMDAPPRRAGRATRARRPRRAHARRSSHCPQPLAPLLSARMRGGRPALRRVLLEVDDAPLLPRSATLEAVRRAERRRRTASLLTRATSTTGRRRHVAAALRRPRTTCRRAARARRAAPRRCPRASSPSPTSTPARRRRADADELAARCARRSPACRAAAVAARRRRVAEPARGRGMSAVDAFTFRPRRRRRWSRTSVLRGLHPMMARAPGPLAAARVRARAPAVAPRTSTCSAASARDEPARTSACSRSPRCATSRRCATSDGRITALPELERMLVEALEAHAPLPGAPPAARAPALEPRAAPRLAADRPRARTRSRALDRRASRRATAGLGLEMVIVHGRLRERDGEVRDRVLRFFTPGRPRRRRRGRRPADARRCSRSTRARSGSSPRAGAACCTRPRSSSCSRPQRATRRGIPPASSSSTTSTTTGGSSRSTARRRPTRAGIVVGLIRNRHRAPPGGHAARGRCSATRRAALGSLAEPECRRIIAALDLAEELGVPRRVVRALRRRADRDGLRHREHGLDRGGAAPDRRVHPGAAARSTSSSPASTSAPSRTGTPRRRCSCTRAASSS